MNAYNGLCLEGEGKGRISQNSGRKLFSFQSKIELENKKWQLGIDIPLHGEELLELSLVEDKLVLGGSFANKMKKFPKKDRLLWKEMTEMLKLFLISLDSNVEASKFQVQNKENGDRQITFLLDNSKMTLLLFAQSQSNDYIEKIEFQYFPNQMSEKYDLSLLLFTNECQNVLKLADSKR